MWSATWMIREKNPSGKLKPLDFGHATQCLLEHSWGAAITKLWLIKTSPYIQYCVQHELCHSP